MKRSLQTNDLCLYYPLTIPSLRHSPLHNIRYGIRSYADKVALGNAQKTITLGYLKHFPIPLPESDEQLRIASILSTHDTRISAEEAHLYKLRQIKQGLMHDLLTGVVRVTQLTAVDAQ